MVIKSMDAGMLKAAFLAGAKGLEAKKDWINELNVFPVPDGDTGTNMTLTIMAAAREVDLLDDPSIKDLCKAISSGSLRGARGNSGVILSQLFRGFTREIQDAQQLDTRILANAFSRGTETAYKAVMKPKEGTILTVSRGMAEKAVEIAGETEDIIEFLEAVIAHGDYVLSQTPEMLPVLKQAGVVDSGGQGLMQVMKGVLDSLLGKEIAYADSPISFVNKESVSISTESSDILFGYCTEFIINLEKSGGDKTEKQLKSYLESIGDSLVVVSDEDIVKIHVHTNDPGLAIQKALTFGTLSRIKIDNMREEHEERLMMELEKQSEKAQDTAMVLQEERTLAQAPPVVVRELVPRKEFGFIAVSVGEGLGEIFRGIGADYLIEGGQTMNPSTEDFLNAIDQVNAEVIYLLPNNKNIILAAEQARGLVTDKNVFVLPSKTVPQGITAIINFVPDLLPEQNVELMVLEMNRVKTGQITYAVRNTTIDDKEIKQGDIMGLGDNGLLAVGQSIEDTALETIKTMSDQESELITIYYGTDITEEEANLLLEKVQHELPFCEVELHSGGQPVYYYLISIE